MQSSSFLKSNEQTLIIDNFELKNNCNKIKSPKVDYISHELADLYLIPQVKNDKVRF